MLDILDVPQKAKTVPALDRLPTLLMTTHRIRLDQRTTKESPNSAK
jgi:hypothetical protein